MELDDLLSEVMKDAKNKQDIATARRKAVTSRPGSAEYEEANAYVKQWERENEWRAVAVELWVVEEQCNCGGRTRVVQGMFHVHQHIRYLDRIDKRAIGKEVPQGPKRTVVSVSKVRICGQCYELQGFPSEDKDA